MPGVFCRMTPIKAGCPKPEERNMPTLRIIGHAHGPIVRSRCRGSAFSIEPFSRENKHSGTTSRRLRGAPRCRQEVIDDLV